MHVHKFLFSQNHNLWTHTCHVHKYEFHKILNYECTFIMLTNYVVIVKYTLMIFTNCDIHTIVIYTHVFFMHTHYHSRNIVIKNKHVQPIMLTTLNVWLYIDDANKGACLQYRNKTQICIFHTYIYHVQKLWHSKTCKLSIESSHIHN